jgi:hypothetical protein
MSSVKASVSLTRTATISPEWLRGEIPARTAPREGPHAREAGLGWIGKEYVPDQPANGFVVFSG